MVIYRLDVMTQKSSLSLMFLQNTGATRRAEHNSWPEQRASAKAPAFPSWQNSISPQVVQQTHRLLPEEIKYLNKHRVVCFSHARRKTQWIRIIQCHHELALKRQKSVYSEWNRVNKHRSLLFFFFFLTVAEGSTDNFPRVIKERLKTLRKQIRLGYCVENSFSFYF